MWSLSRHSGTRECGLLVHFEDFTQVQVHPLGQQRRVALFTGGQSLQVSRPVSVRVLYNLLSRDEVVLTQQLETDLLQRGQCGSGGDLQDRLSTEKVCVSTNCAATNVSERESYRGSHLNRKEQKL